jgi:hypothetical protein
MDMYLKGSGPMLWNGDNARFAAGIFVRQSQHGQPVEAAMRAFLAEQIGPECGRWRSIFRINQNGINGQNYYFEDENEAMMFLLRFSA